MFLQPRASQGGTIVANDWRRADRLREPGKEPPNPKSLSVSSKHGHTSPLELQARHVTAEQRMSGFKGAAQPEGHEARQKHALFALRLVATPAASSSSSSSSSSISIASSDLGDEPQVLLAGTGDLPWGSWGKQGVAAPCLRQQLLLAPPLALSRPLSLHRAPPKAHLPAFYPGLFPRIICGGERRSFGVGEGW